MNKEIFAIFFIAALLIVSAGAVSAADSQDDSKQITVKINWNDAAKVSERPNQVSVNLIKDGSIVDTAVLNESNSWKATFNAQGDGNYKLKASDLNDYSSSIGGSADAGFIVTYALKADVLSASDDEGVVENADDAVVGDDVNSTAGEDVNASDDDVNNDADDSNSTAADEQSDDANATEEANVTDDTNAAEDKTSTTGNDDKDKNAGGTDVKQASNKTSDKNPITKENIKKLHKPLKKNNITNTKLRHTGIPLAILVVAAIASIFVPISRKKK